MAFRVRVLHSLLLVLVGFSLVFCNFFYASPLTVRDHQAVNIISTTSEESSSIIDNETPNETGKRSLQSSDGTIRKTDADLLEKKTSTDNIKLVEKHVVSFLKNATKKQQQDNPISNNTSVAAAAVVPPQPAPPAIQASVIQKIPPKVMTNEIKSLSTDDANSLAIVTKSVYVPGFDIENPDLCSDFGSSLKLLILITTAPSHSQSRMAIRQTWGHYSMRKDIAIAFLLGSTNDAQIQKQIYSESELYGDLIQARFLDSYNNLTLKTVSMLEWVDIYCHKVKFILKTDDDMFINIPKLLTFVDNHRQDTKVIFGRLAKKWKPIRNKKSKYFVSREQYKNLLFPDFTTGPAYLLSGDIVHDLYITALNQTYLKLEDVYTTGIVAQQMKIKRVHINEFLNKKTVLHACNIQKAISIHMVQFHEQFDCWKKLLDGKMKCK